MTALWTNDNPLFMRNNQEAYQNEQILYMMFFDSIISSESDKITGLV